MSTTIQLKKGLNIRLLGEPKKEIVNLEPDDFAIKPTDFTGVFPKVLVSEGDTVKAGSTLFYDKRDERIKFSSPVSGTISEIVRGEKRILLEIRIKTENPNLFENFGILNPSSASREEIIEKLLTGGAWPMIRQRPYNVIANPDDNPKSVYVSCFDSAPLAPDYSLVLKGNEDDFQQGIHVLAVLGGKNVRLGLPAGHTNFPKIDHADITYFGGPHPAGNVGIQIHHTDPLCKGEKVWVVNFQDVIIIGRLFSKGEYDPGILIPLCGSEVKNPVYYRTKKGVSIKPFLKDNLYEGNHRFISGNVLTGTQIKHQGYLGFYHNQFTVIPEGDYYEFLGWALPGFHKFSFSRTFFSWLKPGKKYRLDTNLHGGERAYVMTGEYEKVLPMDIYPMQLIKACLNEDIERMENLGLYEVDEEDFALIEYIDTSKTEIQQIIRKGLDLVRKEMS